MFAAVHTHCSGGWCVTHTTFLFLRHYAIWHHAFGQWQSPPLTVIYPCAGKVKLRGFFVGQAMKASKGRANPAELNRVLDERLTASKPQ